MNKRELSSRTTLKMKTSKRSRKMLQTTKKRQRRKLKVGTMTKTL